MMANSPLPASLNNLRRTAAQFSKMGEKMFEMAFYKNYEYSKRTGNNLKQIVVKGNKESYYDEFF